MNFSLITKKKNEVKEDKKPFTSDEEKEIDKSLKSVVKKYNSDSSIKSRIMSKLKDYMEDDEDLWDGKFHKFGCELYDESTDTEILYDLSPTDDSNIDVQYYNSALMSIRSEIAKELNSVLDYVSASGDYGDGDEGIIRILKK